MVAEHQSIELQSAFTTQVSVHPFTHGGQRPPCTGATCSSGATTVQAHIDGTASAAIWGSHPRTLGHAEDGGPGIDPPTLWLVDGRSTSWATAAQHLAEACCTTAEPDIYSNVSKLTIQQLSPICALIGPIYAGVKVVFFLLSHMSISVTFLTYDRAPSSPFECWIHQDYKANTTRAALSSSLDIHYSF